MTATLSGPAPSPPAETPAATRLGHRLTRRDALAIGVLLVVIITAQAWNVFGYPGLAGNDDEGTYLSQSWAVRTGYGLAHYTYWYDHPPLGWIQIAGLSWLPPILAPGVPAVAAGRLVMLVFTAATVVLLYVVARRVALTRSIACLAVLLYGLSPLALTMHRQIYLDNVAVTWIMAAFALALSPRRHLWSHVGAGVCAGIAVLSKETTLLIIPAVLYVLWQKSHPTTRGFSMVGFFWCGFGLVCAIYPLLAVLKGELLPGLGHTSLFDGIAFQLISRKSSGSVFDSGSDAHGVLTSWVDADPLFLALGAASTIVALAVRRLRGMALAGTLVVIIGLRPGGYLPAMYVIQALPFFALCLAGLGECAVIAARSGRSVTRVIGAVATCALAAVAMYGLAPRWIYAGREAVTVRANDEFKQVSEWFGANVEDRTAKRVLVDDNLWLDMVDIGFVPGRGVIWFNKIDLDPEVAATVRRGWRDIDYLVSTPGLRHAVEADGTLPTTADFIAHSHVVATFGTGVNRIEIRQASGELP